jgi:cellobiose-specific phosphotransferase system component IIB
MNPSPSLRVPFGQKNGRMVSPDQVESGRACNCACPGCGAPLIAKKGEQNVWHFAHDGPACASGAETALHLMAKQVLAAERSIQLPAVEVSISAVDVLGELQTVSTILVGPQNVRYETVQLEVAKDNRRPDALAAGGDVDLEHRIEVYVRHAVDSVKAGELEALDCACYEICLNDIPVQITIVELRHAVVAAAHRVRWISYPGRAAARRALEPKLRELLDGAAQRKQEHDAASAAVYASLAEEDRQEKAEWARQAREKKQREQTVARANASFLCASAEEKRAFLQAKLRFPEGPVPSLLNKRVGGDTSFGVDRDVWQADIFRKCIFGGGRREIALESVLSWMRLRYAIAHEFPNAANIALWKYFSFLEESGFVRHLGRQRFQVLRDAAPWLESVARVSGGWFWAPGAYSCTRDELEDANTRGGFGLTANTLVAILRRFHAEHGANGQPEDVALSVAQRIEISPMVVLHLLAEAGAVSNPR